MTQKKDLAFQLIGISKTYSGANPYLALDSVDLEIQQGEFVSIVGRSGSGKSTLLNLLGCMDRPTRGEIFISGKRASELSDDQRADLRRDELGFIFQAFNLASNMGVMENVELPMMIRGMKKSDRERIAFASLDAVGLSSKVSSMPSQLSGGEKQRVAIARALANNPKILLADEPTGNLDSKSSRVVMDSLESLCRKRGITVILVTHDPALAEEADRTIRLSDGRVESDVRKKTTHRHGEHK